MEGRGGGSANSGWRWIFILRVMLRYQVIEPSAKGVLDSIHQFDSLLSVGQVASPAVSGSPLCSQRRHYSIHVSLRASAKKHRST